MATKCTTKKTAEKKPLTRAEKDKLFSYIGKARVYALKMSKNCAKRQDVRRAMVSIEKKLWALGDAYYWGRLTE